MSKKKMTLEIPCGVRFFVIVDAICFNLALKSNISSHYQGLLLHL